MKRLLMTAVVLITLGFIVPANATYPGSPGKIAFYTFDTFRIYTIEPDGTGRTALTGVSEDAHTPSWSPDGTRIAFATGSRKTAQIEVMDADGSNRSVVLDDQNGTYPGFWGETWSPDGTTLAVCAETHTAFLSRILIVPLATGVPVKIGRKGDCDPSWSPLGDRIAVAHFDVDTFHTSLVTMAVDGSDRLLVAPSGFQPDWSPTGDKIAYSNDDIFIVNADGTGRVRFSNHTNVHEYTPAWSPSGNRIAFAREQAKATDAVPPDDIFWQRLTGTRAVRVTNTAVDEFYLSWQPIVP